LYCDALVRASVVRGVSSSILHVCVTQLPKAKDTFGNKKEVAGNSFWCFQTSTCRSFALERYQASRKEELSIVDRIFIPITNSEAQEANAVQLSLISVMCPYEQ